MMEWGLWKRKETLIVKHQQRLKKKRGDAIAANPQAAKLREDLKKWRSKNGNQQPPESIWKAAVDLAQEYSARSVIRYLGLSSWKFSLRLQTQTLNSNDPDPAQQWLELPMPVAQNQPLPMKPSACLGLEWRSLSGTRLRLRYRKGQQQLLRELLEVLK